MKFSNTNPDYKSLAEIREEAYNQGRADAISDFALKTIQAYYEGTLDECEILNIERQLKEQNVQAIIR